MKALVVYESMWGNTREIAEAVASGLARHVEVTTVDVATAPPTLSDDIELVVAGGPTHAYSLSNPASRRKHAQEGAPLARVDLGLREWLDQLPSAVDAPSFALFDTRLGIARPVPSSAARKAAKIVAERGYPLVSEPHSFYVHGHNGPLAHGERGRAALWGERVALEAQLDRATV
jgi:hypothetical protein